MSSRPSDAALEPSDAAITAVRSAEHEVERAAWDVHCIEFAAERAEEEAAKQRGKAVVAREALAVKRRVLDAVVEQFPEVERLEVDLHGVTTSITTGTANITFEVPRV